MAQATKTPRTVSSWFDNFGGCEGQAMLMGLGIAEHAHIFELGIISSSQ